ncbi:hypothetical protein [Tengunoibacter tsumagoiensis]|uniref:Uncharacterized protein n=1 Tax=Tengunoibacter tsumagoiensis TaxID=2014871 RepID=A0A401ZTR3_9CHLR|nr:hypothetical protein [Tengunoibacter tsumagoiensis]GCE10253.1 hypothetical protein KTT_01120 [Tengunoibacter tsumagoiensis]
MHTFKQTEVPNTSYGKKGRRFSPWMLVGGLSTLLVILGSGLFFFAQPTIGSQAAAAVPNGECSLIVPPQPLTAEGLATPYQLVATQPDKGACHEANAKQAAFVQGAVFDPATNQISIYNPLVVDKGKKPAMPPVVPTLPANAVVGLWFGSNGTVLTLRSSQNSLTDGNCVNGLPGSPFGQFAYCNAPDFFTAVNAAIKAGKLTPPALGMGNDGLTCPSVRDFGVVDMDQSDNVNTTYLIDRKGRVAQMTAANVQQLPEATIQVNGSDNRLLSSAMDGALGCHSWSAPDLADPGKMVPALPLNELQAATYQAAPMATIPANDPMVKVGDTMSLKKLNLYRVGVNQPVVQNKNDASTSQYCKNLLSVAPTRIRNDKAFTQLMPSVDPAVANNLFTFLAQRFNATWGQDGLNCQNLIKQKSPIKVTMNKQGIAVNATFKGNLFDSMGN